jgi:crotonobetainyl-CoA:carnitine CoA-transferase CaiB-like acyl-CoA transferase
MESAGWGFSYMDHHGGNMMAVAILAALVHRQRTGEGQWVDMSCTEAGASMLGPVVLDHSVNGRPLRRPGMPSSNRSQSPRMAPHGVYPCAGDDHWVTIAVRDDRDWHALRTHLGLADRDRFADEDALDAEIAAWTRGRDKFVVTDELQAIGVPAAAVQKPQERIEQDANTAAWGLWPTATHREMGTLPVDGIPVHLSETDWHISRGAPCLGQHNDDVFGGILGLSASEIDALRADGVI